MTATIYTWIIDLLVSSAALLLAVLLWVAAWEIWAWFLDRLVRILGISAELVAFALQRKRDDRGWFRLCQRWITPRSYWQERRKGGVE